MASDRMNFALRLARSAKAFDVAKALAGVLALAIAIPAQAQAQPAGEVPAELIPLYGQAGKDSGYIPTPGSLVERMLEMAKLGPDDLVVDLGSGDGRIPLLAARRFEPRL